MITRSNQHPNPFGRSLTGWAWGGRPVSLATETTEGTILGVESVVGVGTGNVIIWTNPVGSVPVTPGEIVPLSVWVVRSSAGRVQVQWEWRDGVGATSYSPTDWRTLTAGVLAEIAPSVAVPAGIVSARVVVSTEAAGLVTGDTVFVGGVMVGATGTPFDGDTTETATLSYTWAGTPHASASVERERVVLTAAPAWGQRALVTIDVQDAGSGYGGALSLYRATVGGDWVPVAGAQGIPVASTVVPDVAVPVERQVRYQLVAGDGTTWTSGWITVPSVMIDLGPACLITHPVTGEVVPVALVQWKDLVRDSQSTEIQIPGRPEVIRLDGVEMLPKSTPEVLTFTSEAAATLDALLADGEILLFRAACEDYPDTFIGVTRRGIGRVSRRGPVRLQQLTVTTHTHPSLGIRAIGDTLQDLHDAVPTTLQAIADRWPGTLLDIATTDLRAEAG